MNTTFPFTAPLSTRVKSTRAPSNGGGRTVVISNRVPSPAATKSEAGGLSVALRELLEASGGVWFGWSGHVSETPQEPAQVHRDGVDYVTIDLSPEEHDGYYNGFSNAVLWPVLHTMPGLIKFRREDAATYRDVNDRMAVAVLPLLKPNDMIWVQDYHLFQLPERLRAHGVRNPIGFFLHIPFAPLALTSVVPGMKGLIRGMLAADLVGFQTRDDMENFVEAACEIGDTLREGPDLLRSDGRAIRVGVFPVEIEARSFAEIACQASANKPAQRMRDSLQGQSLVLGIDRLDPTKGLAERLRGFGRMLEQRPEWSRRTCMLQIAAASREKVAAYQDLRQSLEAIAGQINAEHGHPDWTPIRLVTRASAREDVAAFMRLARVGLVTPLRDGMNLVAKEFVAAQDPSDPGVLVLSRFAGAAHQLRDALLINPNDPDELADAIERALRMDQGERKRRWQRLWSAIQGKSAAGWGSDFIAALQHATATTSRSMPDAPGAEAVLGVRLPAAMRGVRRPPRPGMGGTGMAG